MIFLKLSCSTHRFFWREDIQKSYTSPSFSRRSSSTTTPGAMSNPNLAEVMGDGPASIADKLTLLPGYEPDFSAVTFCLKEEDHTLGNSLRYIIMKE